MFGQVVEFMFGVIFMKMVFNDLPHALGLLEPFDLAADKIRPELEVEAQLRTPNVVGMSDPVTIEEGLRQSMREEETAIAKYHTRAAHARLNGDELTAEVFEHIAKQEDEHYREFGQRLRERLQGQIYSTSAIIE